MRETCDVEFGTFDFGDVQSIQMGSTILDLISPTPFESFLFLRKFL